MENRRLTNYSIASILGFDEKPIESVKENIDTILNMSISSSMKTRARRARTNFDLSSIKYLDEVFKTNPYPDINERERLAERIDTTEARIQVWFQNKRSRHRKTNGNGSSKKKTNEVKVENINESFTSSIDSAPESLNSSSMKTSSPTVLRENNSITLNSSCNSSSYSPEIFKQNENTAYCPYASNQNYYASYYGY